LQKSTKIAQLKYDDKQSAFVIYSKPADSFPQGSFTNLLKFVVKDCDPETGEADPEGYPDEYEVLGFLFILFVSLNLVFPIS